MGMHQTVKEALVSAAEQQVERDKQLTANASWYHRNKNGIKEVAQALKKIDIRSAEVNGEEVDISITGDKHVLQAIFGAFRKLGYQTSKRPLKNDSYFYCRWEKEGKPTFYFTFSSTVCKRVKVGTKMVEQDVFENVCE